MKQLHALGRFTYQGHFDVLWKKEQFAGVLNTVPGKLNVQLTLDELSKYVFGSVRTDSFELGKAMDMPDLGKIACKAVLPLRASASMCCAASHLPIPTR